VRTLCIGDALVDLICEQPLRDLGDATAFARHPGGATANAAVVAARLGGDVALAGGAGDDAWGGWLRDNLAAEGVGVEWFELVAGGPTAVALVTVDQAGEPSYLVHGGVVPELLDLPAAVDACDALAFASNALVDEGVREATLAARERAIGQGKPVVVDANLRLHRWANPGRAATELRACLPGAFLVKANRAEAKMLSGEDDPVRAAEGLLAGGARNVIVTLGAEGALLRGELRRQVPGVDATVLNTAGAGDTFLGVLLARLGQADYYPPVLAAALAEATREAARATERWPAT
jgi:fructokinase